MSLFVFAAFAYLVMFVPVLGVGAVTGLIGRGRVVVHPFETGRANAVAGRAWLWLCAGLVAGVVGVFFGPLFVGGGEDPEPVIPAEALAPAIGLLGVVVGEAYRTSRGRWTATGAPVRVAWWAWVAALVAPCLVGLAGTTGLSGTLAAELGGVDGRPAFGGLGDLRFVLPMIVPVGVAAWVALRTHGGETFGDWYLARRTLHGAALCGWLTVVPSLAFGVVLDQPSVVELIGGTADTADGPVTTGIAVAEAALLVGISGLLFHLGRLCVLPRAVGADSFADVPSVWVRR